MLTVNFAVHYVTKKKNQKQQALQNMNLFLSGFNKNNFKEVLYCEGRNYTVRLGKKNDEREKKKGERKGKRKRFLFSI